MIYAKEKKRKVYNNVNRFNRLYIHDIYNTCLTNNVTKALNKIMYDERIIQDHIVYEHIPHIIHALYDAVVELPPIPTQQDFKIFADQMNKIQDQMIGGAKYVYDGINVVPEHICH